MDNIIKFESQDIDILIEVGNVGVGNASTALSKMLNRKVNIELPETKFVPLEDFPMEIGGQETIIVAVYFQITGNLQGEALFLFPQNEGFKLIDLIMAKPAGETKMLDKTSESAFKETANIFTGAYLNALAKMFEMKIFPSIPHSATDMAQAIIDFLLIKLSKKVDNLLCVKTKINIDQQDINGMFVILFEEESLKLILETIKKNYGLI